MKKYYDAVRKQNKKYRKKLIRTLKKEGYATEDMLRIIDSFSGKPPAGKEKAAQELLTLIADGADRETVFAFLDSRNATRFLPVD